MSAAFAFQMQNTFVGCGDKRWPKNKSKIVLNVIELKFECLVYEGIPKIFLLQIVYSCLNAENGSFQNFVQFYVQKACDRNAYLKHALKAFD